MAGSSGKLPASLIPVSFARTRYHGWCAVYHRLTPYPPTTPTLAHNARAMLLDDSWRYSSLSVMYSKARYPFTSVVAIMSAIVCAFEPCKAAKFKHANFNLYSQHVPRHAPSSYFEDTENTT
jgi:hypothetical protein